MSESKNILTVPGVLARMDRDARRVCMAVLAAAMLEGLLLVIALLKIDWNDATQVLIFIFAVLGYTIVALGLAAAQRAADDRYAPTGHL